MQNLLKPALAAIFLCSLVQAQDSAANVDSPPAMAASTVAPAVDANTVHEDKRIFGVLPNYRTTEEGVPFSKITVKQKFTIAFKDTTSPPSYLLGLGGIFAGLSQLNNSNPSFGQGLSGFAKRYGTNTADQDIGNFMTEAIMPSLLHEDPRYFRKGRVR
jgi:hypothetical protein